MRHKDFLKEQLKDPDFKKIFYLEKQINDIALRIAEERNRKGFSQEELSEKIKIKQQQLSRVEQGANFTISTLIKILNALGLKIRIVSDNKSTKKRITKKRSVQTN